MGTAHALSFDVDFEEPVMLEYTGSPFLTFHHVTDWYRTQANRCGLSKPAFNHGVPPILFIVIILNLVEHENKVSPLEFNPLHVRGKAACFRNIPVVQS